jgi:hypothetical protein
MNYVFKRFLGKGNKITLTDKYAEISTTRYENLRIPLDYIFTENPYAIRLVEVYLKFIEGKSQEEVAAEEAVRKAKESLKAAEDVLNKVKKEN